MVHAVDIQICAIGGLAGILAIAFINLDLLPAQYVN